MRCGFVALAACLTGCAPDLPNDTGLIAAPRVIAVRADPAEAKPGSVVAYTALVAAPAGSELDARLTWDFCTAPKPPTEDNAVADACLDPGALVPAGEGVSITATTPRNACSLFGPDTPPGSFRPRDPDVTGGYYEPLRVNLTGADPSFALERLLCGLGMASADLATAFASDYTPNANPTLLPLSLSVAGTETPLAQIPPNAAVTLSASWPADDAETYAYFDRDAQSIGTRRESMRVTWYATAGRFDAATTGRDEAALASSTTNVWTAPASAGPVVLWLVLQDSRGGVDFGRYDAQITP